MAEEVLKGVKNVKTLHVLLFTNSLYYLLNYFTGDSTVGKSAVTQVFHSDGTHFPKNYNMVGDVMSPTVI